MSVGSTQICPANNLHVAQLAEAIHRARNDIATIASMLQLQARLSDNQAVIDALHAAEMRVMAIARVNAALDNAVHAEPMIDVTTLLTCMANDLQAAQVRSITITTCDAAGVVLPASYARPLGLIANEWVTNALKYAFPGDYAGAVAITLRCDGNDCQLMVSDDGVGMNPEKSSKGTGLGTRLASLLARQISGRIKHEPIADGGTRWTLTFSRRHHREADV